MFVQTVWVRIQNFCPKLGPMFQYYTISLNTHKAAISLGTWCARLSGEPLGRPHHMILFIIIQYKFVCKKVSWYQRYTSNICADTFAYPTLYSILSTTKIAESQSSISLWWGISSLVSSFSTPPRYINSCPSIIRPIQGFPFINIFNSHPQMALKFNFENFMQPNSSFSSCLKFSKSGTHIPWVI